MTTMKNNKMVFCKHCINCMRVSSLNNDVVLWDCEKGKFTGITQNKITCDGLESSDPHEFGLLMVDGCECYNGGSYSGEDKEEFKDVMVTSRNVKRKQKAFDYYESAWRV
jgi:uncharacterized OsmC-like protein